MDDIGVLVESNRGSLSLPTASVGLRYALLRFARKRERERSKPEKYCAGSRRNAHVPAMLGMSVGDRWSGTTAWRGSEGGEQRAGERAGKGERKVEIAPGRWAISSDFRRTRFV